MTTSIGSKKGFVARATKPFPWELLYVANLITKKIDIKIAVANTAFVKYIGTILSLENAETIAMPM